MKLLKKIRLACETFLVRLGLAVIPRLPRQLVLGLAAGAGMAGYCLACQSRRVALANLDIAFQDKLSARAKQRIARQAFGTMARTVLDMFWFSRHTQERLARYVSFDAAEIKRAIYHQPMIGLTAHFGSWELLSRWLVAQGYAHAVVAAPLINPEVERLFHHSRISSGMEILAQTGAVRGLLKALRNKKHIALAVDQNVKPEAGGVFVNFFGLPIPMSGMPARLALRTGTPLVVLFCGAAPGGTYHVYGLPPLQPTGALDAANIQCLTQQIADLFQQEIKKQPEQWLWMYKRWKHIPPSMPRAAYPFYAKQLLKGS